MTMTTEKGDGNNQDVFVKGGKGRILVLGGSGFLGLTVSKRAILEGYSVTSLSRRGKPPKRRSASSSFSNADSSSTSLPSDEAVLESIDYRTGDARNKETILAVLESPPPGDDGRGFVAVVHCIGILFDSDSRLRRLNRFISRSGSVPGESSTYDDVTRLTAFNAIEASEEYVASRRRVRKEEGGQENEVKPLPFLFASAAEAGWTDVRGGGLVERTAPRWFRRYLAAKRAVESRLFEGRGSGGPLRPVVFRPSLIYSLDKVASLPPVGAFLVGNRLGLPFVDRPVTVQSLSFAMVRAIGDEGISGVQRYMDIDKLNELGKGK